MALTKKGAPSKTITRHQHRVLLANVIIMTGGKTKNTVIQPASLHVQVKL
jgi:hypothetical protein